MWHRVLFQHGVRTVYRRNGRKLRVFLESNSNTSRSYDCRNNVFVDKRFFPFFSACFVGEVLRVYQTFGFRFDEPRRSPSAAGARWTLTACRTSSAPRAITVRTVLSSTGPGSADVSRQTDRTERDLPYGENRRIHGPSVPAPSISMVPRPNRFFVRFFFTRIGLRPEHDLSNFYRPGIQMCRLEERAQCAHFLLS